MRFAKISADYFCGIDLHARSMYVCIMDREGKILFHRNMKNDFAIFKESVKAFLPNMAVAVESSSYYYWLADACRKHRIPFHLGHALYMKAVHGGKAKNDKIDSRKIADLARSNMLPMAYPYPKSMRATRDLFRKRHYFVRKRAGAYKYLQNIFLQQGVTDIDLATVKCKDNYQKLVEHFNDIAIQTTVKANLDFINSIDPIVHDMESKAKALTKNFDHTTFKLLRTTPGIGGTIALIILYETHDIARFKSVQKYSSYAGVVKCRRSSNGKKMKTQNHKIRNPYLKWAFTEIIISAQRVSPQINTLYNNIKSKYGKPRAKSIIAHRFAVAIYFMMKNKQVFDEDRFCKTNKYN